MASLDLLLKLGFRFNPSPEEVVTYYLPRLVAGKQPKDTEACIHRTDVYGAKAEPGDLAGRFAPVARSSSGDRFFFTECRRVKGRVSRAAGGGTWVSQSSKDIKNREGIKVGEIKNFRFKKDGKHKDWLMEEYHGCMQEAGDVEPVVCRIYVSPRAAQDSAARQESAALPPSQELAPPPAPAPAALPAPPRQVPVITQQAPPLKKRPPEPVAKPPFAKKMRGAVSASSMAYQTCVAASAPPPRCAPPRPAPPSRHIVAPPPPHPPIQTYPLDPFEPPPPCPPVQTYPMDPFEPPRPPPPPPPAASVNGGHDTPQPSVPATPEEGLAPAASNDPVLEADNDGISMEELMRFLDEEADLFKNDKPEKVLAVPTNDDEDDEFLKLLEDTIEEEDSNHKLQKDNEVDDGEFARLLQYALPPPIEEEKDMTRSRRPLMC